MNRAPEDALKALREARSGAKRIDQEEKRIEDSRYEKVDGATRARLENEYRDVDVSSSDEEPAAKRPRRERRAQTTPTPAAPQQELRAAPSTAPPSATHAPPRAASHVPTPSRQPQVSLTPLYNPKKNLLEQTRDPTPPLDARGEFWFYFLDAHEEVMYGSTKVLLFGKVLNIRNELRNCCVVVEKMRRNVFFIMSKQESFAGCETNLQNSPEVMQNAKEAFQEVSKLCGTCGVGKIEAKPVTRYYPFEKVLPFPHGKLQCLKVHYDFNSPALPDTFKGEPTTFCQVFGKHTSAWELLMKKRRIKGPMWMKIRVQGTSVKSRYTSHCPFEVHVDNHKSISTFEKNKETGQVFPRRDMPATHPAPQVLTLGMKTRHVHHEDGDYQEPTVITMNYHPKLEGFGDMKEERELFHFVFTLGAPPIDLDPQFSSSNTIVYQFSTEEQMLRKVVDTVAEIDPDVLVQHNAFGLGLDILSQRLQARSRGDNLGWHRLSRVDRNHERMANRRSAGFFGVRKLTVGRMVCDTLLSAREFLGKHPNYDLDSLAETVLRVPNERPFPAWSSGVPSSSDKPHWNAYVHHTLIEAKLTFRLLGFLKILPLTKQLTNVAGNLWHRSLQMMRAERVECLLLHEFYAAKNICPDSDKGRKFKVDDMDDEGGGGGGRAGGKRGKAAYSGGLVLEPKTGLYDDFVLMLDFNSLYPSLIQEFNICFTTVQRPRGEHVTSMEETDLLNQTILPTNVKDEGILPRVIRRLVEKRREAKKSKEEIKQKALKLVANSIYGCLGFSSARFYAKPLAAMIPARGREALQDTVNMVNKLKYEVVYGDTDSVFIRSFTKDFDEAQKVAQDIKSAVNRKYRKLEIDVDGIFVRLLLLKKKKYAGIKVNNWSTNDFEQEYKGLELVRRDWCELSKRMGREILSKILSLDMVLEESVEWVHEYLRSMGKNVDEKKIPLADYIITKALTKAPKDYPDAKGQPHVQVALRMLANGSTVVGNQEIPYVICKTDDASMALRARHPSEVAADSSLNIDFDWYKRTQLHPPILRILGPIDGTDAARIAECLGLDGSRFIVTEAHTYNADISYETMMDPTTRFRQLDLDFDIVCPHCKEHIILRDALGCTDKLELKQDVDGFAQCSKCNEYIHPTIVENQSALGIRQLLNRYALCETRCTEPMCDHVSRDVSLRGLGQRCEIPKCKAKCEKTFGERDLQNQLDLLGHMFTIANQNPTNENAYARGKKFIDDILENSEYSWIRKDFFGSIFGGSRVDSIEQA